MSKYSDETRAAVMAALLAGQSVSSVAKEYQLPKGTVSNWKRKVFSAITPGVQAERTQKIEANIGPLILDYLQANLQALRLQVDAFSNQEWLKKQTASDAAVLHGVMTDKAMRLLEALGNASNDNVTEG